MSRSTSAVDAVMGKLFERGHRKERADPSQSRRARAAGGAARRPSISRMRRAGAADGKAIFKLVRSGGTQSRSGLKGQLNYVFRDDKLARVIDPTARVDRMDQPENADINRITRDWSADWWKNTRNGNTSHMILSYPKGVSIDQVETITRAVCDEMFETGDRRFKYIAGIHDDTEHHPHAHIVLNRRADDGTLFTMRSGTEFSYEGFREAMAAHAERIGVYLDPTFRFERGITAAQPDRDEQLLAQKEGRAPVQRRREGVELAEQRELIAYSKIAYEAMAVIAHNADAPRLEAAYREIAEIMESSQGDFQMPELSGNEIERFDQYTALLGDTIARAERVIETKSAADRAPMERRLDDIMQSFTALSPKAAYAKDLHEAPGAATIYMHRLGERGEALTTPVVQEHVAEVADIYGLDAAAVTARLQTGAESRRLEDVWLIDDLRRVADKAGVDLTERGGQEEALGRLDGAYQALREPLVRDRVLALVPHLEEDYDWRPPQSDTYRFEANRLGTDVEALVQHYRENGAPREWIEANRVQIADDLARAFKEEREDYLRRYPELTAPLTEAARPKDGGGFEIVERSRAEGIVKALPDVDRDKLPDVVGRALVKRNPDIPHHVVDHLTGLTIATQQVLENSEAARIRDQDIASPEIDIQANRASILADVSRGVSAQFDGVPDEYSQYEALVIQREIDRPNNDNLVAAVLDADRARQSKTLSDVENNRYDALIADTVGNYRLDAADFGEVERARLDALKREYLPTRSAVERKLPDAFDAFRARSAVEKDLTRDGIEHRALVQLIRENTTEDQYRRLERGDITAVSHLTTDPTFARQLSREVDIAARGTGARYDPEVEARIRDNREYLDRQFDRDDSYDRER